MPIIKTTGDGNCWYRALSLYQQGNEDDHLNLRQDVVAFMWKHKHRYRNLVTDGNIDEFIFKQRRDHEYAEGAALQASADLIGICFFITVRDLDGKDVITYKIEPSQNQHKTKLWLHVRQTGENHFDVVGYLSPTRSYGMRPSNSVPWYGGNSDHDKPHTGDKEENLCVQNLRREEEEKKGTTLSESDIASCLKTVDIRAPQENTFVEEEENVKKQKNKEKKVSVEKEKVVTEEDKLESNEPSDEKGKDDICMRTKNIDIRGDGNNDISLQLSENKLPVQKESKGDENNDISLQLSENKLPVQKESKEKFIDIHDDITESIADKDDVTNVNEVVEFIPDDTDGKTKADSKGNNNKEDNSDNPKYIDIQIDSIEELVRLSKGGGLSWTHFKVYRKIGDYHHHFLVLNSNEKGIIVVHFHLKLFENWELKVICELQNILFCDRKTWCELLDFDSGLFLVERLAYPDIHVQSETELFHRLREVLGCEDYSLIDESKFYCETLVTYILTGRKISTEVERFKRFHPIRAMSVFDIVESFMCYFGHNVTHQIVILLITLLIF